MVDIRDSGTVDFFLPVVGGGATHGSGGFCDLDCTQDQGYISCLDRASTLPNFSVYFPYLPSRQA